MTPTELSDLQARVRILEQQMAENTELVLEGNSTVKQIREDTSALVEFTKNAVGALNTLNFVIKIFKPFTWLGAIIISGYAVFYAAKTSIIAAIKSGHIQ